MFCPNCGKELANGAAFCGGCGTKIGEAKVAQATAAPAPAATAAPAAAPVAPSAPSHKGNKLVAALLAVALIIFSVLPIIFWFGDNIVVDVDDFGESYVEKFTWDDIYEDNDDDMMIVNGFRITSVVLLSVTALLSVVAILTKKYGITFVGYAAAIVSFLGALLFNIDCRDSVPSMMKEYIHTTFGGVMIFVCSALLIILPIIIMCVAPRRVYVYTGPAVGTPPALKLKTNRELLKYILLSIITFGIYPIVVMSTISTDINEIASRYDGRKTMHFCLVAFVFSWLTFGIVPLVWYHNLSDRIGCELRRRGIAYPFGAGTYWGWAFLGSFIYVGPFVYCYKLFKSMNMLCANYNING